MVFYKTMKNRIELAKHFATLGFRKGAEIGVASGYYSQILMENIPELELLCVDSWQRRKSRNKCYPEAVQALSPYPKARLIKGFSMDVAKTVPDESLDFVYIDADHTYESVKEDINAWAKKVRKGGIVSGHDYYEFKLTKSCEVIRAVDEYVQEHGLELQLTEWCNEVKNRDDKQPSWYFIKQ